MTCHVERQIEGSEVGTVKRMIFRCDHEDCPAEPRDTEIIAAGGLIKMGWECVGGKHYCPEHRLTPAPAMQAIDAELVRRIEEEGFTAEHDDALQPGSLAAAAGCYVLFAEDYPNAGQPPPQWPWAPQWWKPKDQRRDLERAGAMIAAELARMDRIKGRAATQ